jgi:hypothetical protein
MFLTSLLIEQAITLTTLSPGRRLGRPKGLGTEHRQPNYRVGHRESISFIISSAQRNARPLSRSSSQEPASHHRTEQVFEPQGLRQQSGARACALRPRLQFSRFAFCSPSGFGGSRRALSLVDVSHEGRLAYALKEMSFAEWFDLKNMKLLSQHTSVVVAAAASFYLSSKIVGWAVGPGLFFIGIEYGEKFVLTILLVWFTVETGKLLWKGRVKISNAVEIISLVA